LWHIGAASIARDITAQSQALVEDLLILARATRATIEPAAETN
jgi:hypothetical protein